MSSRSLTGFHSYAGVFTDTSQLPNVAGATWQTPNLEQGDTAYIAPGRIFVCVTATLGAAVWVEYNSELIAGYPLHLYVSNINGSDTNTGLSPSDPLQTLTKAETLIANVVNSPVVIHVGRFDLTGLGSYVAPKFRRRNLRESIYLVGDGAGQTGAAGEAFTELQASTAVGGGSTANVIKWGGGTDYRGKTVEILTGTSATDRRTIRNANGTDIVPVAPFSTGGATTYRIVETTVNIGFTDTSTLGEYVLCEGLGSGDATPASDVITNGLYVVNVRFVSQGAVSGSLALCLKDSQVVFFGCEFQEATTINIRMDSSSLTMGHNGSDFARAAGSYNLGILGVMSNLQWRGWGFASTTASAAAHNFFSGGLDGYFVAKRNVNFRDNVTANIRGGSFQNTLAPAFAPITVYKASAYIIGPGIGFSSADAPQILIESSVSLVAGVDVDYLGRCGVANCHIVVPTAPASCIRAIRGGVAEIAAASTPNTGLTGSGGGYALLAYFGGKIWGQELDASPPTRIWTDFALTGGLGYLSVDSHTNSDNGLTPGAVLVTSGDQIVNSDGSSIFRVA